MGVKAYHVLQVLWRSGFKISYVHWFRLSRNASVLFVIWIIQALLVNTEW